MLLLQGHKPDVNFTQSDILISNFVCVCVWGQAAAMETEVCVCVCIYECLMMTVLWPLWTHCRWVQVLTGSMGVYRGGGIWKFTSVWVGSPGKLILITPLGQKHPPKLSHISSALYATQVRMRVIKNRHLSGWSVSFLGRVWIKLSFLSGGGSNQQVPDVCFPGVYWCSSLVRCELLSFCCVVYRVVF